MEIGIKKFSQGNLNYLFFFLIVVSFLGSLFLAMRDFQPGLVYSLIIIGSIGLLFLLFFFLKNDDSLKPLTDFVMIPLTRVRDMAFAIKWYLIGFGIPIVLSLLLRLSQSSFSITSFSIPLFGAEFTTGFQSFATAEIGGSMPWKIFTVVFTAGTAETFMYNIALPLAFILIGVFTLMLIGSKRPLFMSKKNFLKVFMMLSVSLLFVLSHILNATYQGIMFWIAGLFMLISIASIYWGLVSIIFWVGYHQSNNLMYLIEQEGIFQVLQGFYSVFGIIMIIYFFLMIFYVARNWKKSKRPA